MTGHGSELIGLPVARSASPPESGCSRRFIAPELSHQHRHPAWQATAPIVLEEMAESKGLRSKLPQHQKLWTINVGAALGGADRFRLENLP